MSLGETCLKNMVVMSDLLGSIELPQPTTLSVWPQCDSLVVTKNTTINPFNHTSV